MHAINGHQYYAGNIEKHKTEMINNIMTIIINFTFISRRVPIA